MHGTGIKIKYVYMFYTYFIDVCSRQWF